MTVRNKRRGTDPQVIKATLKMQRMKDNKRRVSITEPASWREGNDFRLLKDAPAFYPLMIQSIESAKRYILMEMYLFESGHVAARFIDAFCNAAQRGVIVCLLLDDFGSWALGSHDRKRLAESGVSVAFFNPIRYGNWFDNLKRNHRKLLLVDGTIAFTGGAGITDAFSHEFHPSSHWRDTMIEISGPVIADWQASFQSLWDQWGHPAFRLPVPGPVAEKARIRGRLTLLQPPDRRDVIRSVITRLRMARRRVWIETAYFIPSWKMRRALIKAARAAVDVRLLLPGAITDHPPVRRISQRYYQPLLRNGIKIFEYEPRFLHSKIMLCDDWVSIGSSNLDKWSIRWNLEANLEADDPDFADEARRLFLSDFGESREILYGAWLKRPWHLRFRENFWQSVMIWTEYLIRLREMRLVSSPRRTIKHLFHRNRKKLH